MFLQKKQAVRLGKEGIGMDLEELEKNGESFDQIAEKALHHMQHDRDFCQEGRLKKEHLVRAFEEIGIDLQGKFCFRTSQVTSKRPSVILMAPEGEFELWRSPLSKNIRNVDIEVSWAEHKEAGTNPCGGPYQGGYNALYV